MARDANNEILSRRDFNKLVCCLAEEIGGGASLPAGTENDTLRFDGVNWVASSFLKNFGNGIDIGTHDATTDNTAILNLRQTSGNNNIRLWRTNNSASYWDILTTEGTSDLAILNNAGFRAFRINGIGVNIGTNTSPLYSLDVGNVRDGIRFAQGTTAQRPTHAAGVMRWNTDTGSFEFSDGAAWNNFAVGTLPSGTDAQTLRYNGTILEANSFLKNSGTQVYIGSGIPNGGWTAMPFIVEDKIALQTTGGGGNQVYISNSGGYMNFFYSGTNGFRLGNTNIRMHFPVNIGSSAPVYSLDSEGNTDGWRFPRGTTAQRPTHGAGVLRWNTDTAEFEYSDGAAWNSFGGASDGNGIFDIANNGGTIPTTFAADITDTFELNGATNKVSLALNDTAPQGVIGAVNGTNTSNVTVEDDNVSLNSVNLAGSVLTKSVKVTDLGVELGAETALPFTNSTAIGSGNFVTNGDRQVIEFSMGAISSSDVTPAQLFVDNVSQLAVIPANTIWNGTLTITAVCTSSGTSGSVTRGETTVFNRLVSIAHVDGSVRWLRSPADILTPVRDTNMAGDSISGSANNIDKSLDLTYNRPTASGTDTVFQIHASFKLNQMSIPAG